MVTQLEHEIRMFPVFRQITELEMLEESQSFWQKGHSSEGSSRNIWLHSDLQMSGRSVGTGGFSTLMQLFFCAPFMVSRILFLHLFFTTETSGGLVLKRFLLSFPVCRTDGSLRKLSGSCFTKSPHQILINTSNLPSYTTSKYPEINLP